MQRRRLGELEVSAVGLGGPDVTGVPAAVGALHRVGGDRQPALAHIGPVRAEAAVRPVEIIRRTRPRQRSLREREQREENTADNQKFQKPGRPQP